MSTEMMVHDEVDRGPAVIVLLLIGFMLFTGTAVLVLVWASGGGRTQEVADDAPLSAPVVDWLANRYAREATARDAASASYAPAAERYYEAAREAKVAVVEMERYQEVIAAEREFTYTTAAAVQQGRRAAAALAQGSGNVVEMERYQEVIAAEREFTYTTAEAVERGRRAAEAFWRVWEAVATGRV
jgi:hypothetical protein